jgi:hypothetical protein
LPLCLVDTFTCGFCMLVLQDPVRSGGGAEASHLMHQVGLVQTRLTLRRFAQLLPSPTRCYLLMRLTFASSTLPYAASFMLISMRGAMSGSVRIASRSSLSWGRFILALSLTEMKLVVSSGMNDHFLRFLPRSTFTRRFRFWSVSPRALAIASSAFC